ncbi:MAG: 16S rRNA (cytidine(1402)-2'-O)-methyltransferase [Proteobacteria bacterium]|nr:16S rRNA (cytidine(1402)-2'-O)-methyltransferase [Pseudomonadota bacterium]
MSVIDASLLRSAAAAAAGHQRHPGATLYLVATPIGNRADITLRALHLLQRADCVACEDTRVTAQLLAHYGVAPKPLLAVHAHNENEAAERVCQRLAAGDAVAFVSDAGTPGVSDPGARLVAAAVAAGFAVVPIPGPSSALAALSVAGDVGDAAGGAFVFQGFLPAKGAERQAALQAACGDARTQILFEAPHRVRGLLQDLAAAAPQRRLTVARELTKQFEAVATLAAADAPAWLAADAHRERGEFVLVLHAAPPAPAAAGDALPAAAEHCLAVLQRELPLKQAVVLAAEISGAPRKALYQRALQRRGEGRDIAAED